MNMTFSDRMSGLKPSAIREIFKILVDPEVIPFSAGNPSPETFPVKEMSEIAADIFARESAFALQYGITEGYAPLRTQTRDRLKARFNSGQAFDEVLITTGGQQGMDLTVKVFCNEGDVVLCESPSFIGALNCMRSYSVALRGVPMEEDGMDLDALEEALSEEPRVKLIYTIPTFQNPTGHMMSLEKRRRLLALAQQYDVMIVEDNPYYELYYDAAPPPTIKSMDTEGRVVYLGSYSKIISPGMRLGFVLADQEIISKMTTLKQVSDVHTNLFFQMVVSKYMQRFDLDAHVETCRALYRTRRDSMYERLITLGDRLRVSRPGGGLFLWCGLPDGCDAFKLAALSGKNKVAIVPGSTFSIDESETSPYFRLNFSLATPAQIEEGCDRLIRAVRELLP